MPILQRFSEHFTSTWKLLSETTTFLSKTSLLYLYEFELKELRHRLETFREDRSTVSGIRKEIVDIRASLRLNGYDLSLGDYRLVVDDFKNDAAMDQYRRMVLFIGKGRLWLTTGTANHVTLYEYLSAEKHGQILQVHFLWYRWVGTTLYLSGSDSEDKASFEKLRAWSELPENRFLVLRSMKNRA